MSNTTLKQEQKGELSTKALSNLDEIELDVTTSSQYFKPRAGTVYMIQIDLDKHSIQPVESEQFKDSKGKPLKRYELVITHVNNGKEQVWTVSKTVMLQITEQLRKGFKVLKIVRTGEDRTTTYKVEGVQ
jgi:hypothetical protein